VGKGVFGAPKKPLLKNGYYKKIGEEMVFGKAERGNKDGQITLIGLSFNMSIL